MGFFLFPWCKFSFFFGQTSDLWNKRHSVAIGDVHECKLIRRKEITPKQVDHIWKSMTVAQYVTLLILMVHFHTFFFPLYPTLMQSLLF